MPLARTLHRWLANGGLPTRLGHGDPRPNSDGYLYQRRVGSIQVRKELQGGTAPSGGLASPSASAVQQAFTATVSCTVLREVGMQRYG